MKKLIFLIAIGLMGQGAFAQDKALVKVYADKTQSSITYSMNHPLHAWTGESKDVTSIILTDENRKLIDKVAVSVKIASFDSQNANRDSHMIETTEGIIYPTISFASDSIKNQDDKLKVYGTLTFHGVAQKVFFEADKKVVNKKAEITGAFSVKMTDYKVEPPSLMGMATDDEIKLSFKAVY